MVKSSYGGTKDLKGVSERRGGHGKPSQTGVEHAEAVVNAKGVQHGIENAEAKQSLHKGSKKTNKGKTKGKHKGQKSSSASH